MNEKQILLPVLLCLLSIVIICTVVYKIVKQNIPACPTGPKDILEGFYILKATSYDSYNRTQPVLNGTDYIVTIQKNKENNSYNIQSAIDSTVIFMLIDNKIIIPGKSISDTTGFWDSSNKTLNIVYLQTEKKITDVLKLVYIKPLT